MGLHYWGPNDKEQRGTVFWFMFKAVGSQSTESIEKELQHNDDLDNKVRSLSYLKQRELCHTFGTKFSSRCDGASITNLFFLKLFLGTSCTVK